MKNGLMLVFLTALISGVSIFLNKYSVSVINPYIFTFLKNVMVAVALLAVILMWKNWNEVKHLSKKQWLQLILIGLIGGSIPFLLFFKGLSMTSSAVGSFIHKTMFIYVGLIAVMFLKEKMRKSVFIAALLLLAGNFLILKIGKFTFGTGEILILLATLFWAVENVISKNALKTISGNVVACGRMLIGSVFIMIFLGATNQLGLVKTLGASQVLWTLFTAALLLGFVMTWYNGLKEVNVTTATSILLLGSPVTTLLNAVTLGQITGLEVIGTALLLCGVIVMLAFNEKTNQETFSIA
ncbi:MAG TPA: DMT family transporter [Candidatus Nanoarchaeia archaeon]|nr:DMT family transporter [Candidatus Nanoarchaeia archaeon]